MTDDLDPSRLLASAALDDEATPAEHAQIAASAELTAEVETYRIIRDEIRAVDVPHTARETAIAAALAAFDLRVAELGDAAVDPPTGSPAAARAPVVSIRARRSRRTGWLGGAVAAATVGVLTIAALNATSGSDSKSSSATVGEVPIGSAARSAQPEAADTATGAAASGSATAGTTAMATADSNALASAELPTANSEVRDPWVGVQSLVTHEQLIAFATDITSDLAGTAVPATSAAPAATTPVPAVETSATTGGTVDPSAATVPNAHAYDACVVRTSLPAAPAVYDKARVIIERDDAAGQVIVVDPLTCSTILIVALPAQ